MTQISDPEISCPQCQSKIRLTESLAGPILAATRADYEDRLQKQSQVLQHERAAIQGQQTKLDEARAELEKEIASRLEIERANLREQQSKLAHAQANLEEQVIARLQVERSFLVAQEQKRVRSTMDFEFAQMKGQLGDLQGLLAERELKLTEAQKQQAKYLEKERELADQKRELEVTIEKRVQVGSDAIRAKAKSETELAERLKVVEKEEIIASMQRQIEELKRRAEQGSQQLQGEALELDFETQIAYRFPHDRLEAVAKGELGADIVQYVMSADGRPLGKIIWELKRTRNWSDSWLGKLRDDQRNITAELAIIVSAALPKDIETIGFVDGIHVVHPNAAFALATILRQSLAEVARVKVLAEGQSTKVEQIYAYLTGAKFKHRVDAIVENFRAEQDALNKERKFMNRQWAKREQQLLQVLEASTGMYGDLQGIAGTSMLSIAALEHIEDDELE
jgi:hypothetical protein